MSRTATGQPAPLPEGAAEVVSRYGLRAVEPPVAAIEFSLPEIGGGKLALSDFAGRWVVLTFWATWCGPCRSEMPSLERLHRNRESAGVSVVGVSVDRTAAVAERFVTDYSLTFPNLWDHRGAAASAYRAQSIPLTYLIDPAGRIAAVSLGARDWLALQPMIDELLELMPATDQPSAGYETTDGSLELPRSFEPPTAEAVVSSGRHQVGDPISVEVRVQWAGHIEDYLLHPPRIALPEQVEQTGLTASSRSGDGRNVVTYRVDLEAREPGSYALNPVELIYTPRGEAEPVSSRVEGPTVIVSEATLLGLPPATLLTAVGGLLVLVVAGFGLASRLRGARGAEESGDEDRLAELAGRLEQARRSRLEGDLRGAALTLAELERELGVDGESERAALDELTEGARYGGYTPSREELDTIERRVARRVRELEEDPRQAARDALRLRNQES